MEIFIKDQGVQSKINWFSSIPEKYRNEILDRLKHDKLQLDDPSCSQYQIVLDLMGKDEAQLVRDKKDKLEKQYQDAFVRQQEERRLYEEGQASAYLVKDSQNADGEKKQLIFTVPEHPKPKFLSKTALLQQILSKEAEQQSQNSEDNQFIFNEIMKNEIIRDEFEKIRDLYGNDAFELNRLSLLNFIKKGKHNFTYSVKYYGIDEGQIGILSRKVPYDESFKRQAQSYRLPRIDAPPNLKVHKPVEQEQFDLVEIEVSEDESFEVEVDESSEEELSLPRATLPKANIDILQGSVGGREFDGVKKDSKPINLNGEEAVIEYQPPKLKPKKKIKEKRRVKKKRLVKKPKPIVKDERSRDLDSFQNANSFQNQPSETFTLEIDNQQSQNGKSQQKMRYLQQIRSKTNLNRQRQQSQEKFIQDIDSEFKELEETIDQQAPYLINFRELFKKCELQNLKEFKKPEPDKYNEHIVHQYSLPKGLHSLKRTQFLSEAETHDRERYSKKNVQLHMIDKEYQKMNLGGQTYGMKGSKVKPIYFPFNHTTSLSNSQSTSMLFQGNSQQSISSQLMTQPIRQKPLQQQQNQISQTRNVSGILEGNNKIFANDSINNNKQSQVTLESMQSNANSQGLTFQKSLPLQKVSEEPTEPISRAEQLSENQAQFQFFQNQIITNANTNNQKLPSLLNSNDVSKIQQNSITQGPSVIIFDKNASLNIQTSGIIKPQNQLAKKNNQIIKNLTRNKKKTEFNENDEYQMQQQIGVMNKDQQFIKKTMMRNASGSHLQYGFQIQNQMKIPYLMDTRKLLEQRKRKINAMDEDSSNDEEDMILFHNEQQNRAERNIQLPHIKNPTPKTSSPSKDQEVYLNFIRFKNEQSRQL